MAEPATKKTKTVLTIGGVPEHFNFPWRMAQKEGLFKKHGVEVEFLEQKLGTGAMISAVKDGSLDVIVALTEGLVKDIASGSDLRILGTYVASPLCWAISVGKDSKQTVEDLRDGTFSVSRMGSGSHLMASVLAYQRGWDLSKVDYHIAGDIFKLCDSVNDGTGKAFLWETFTTKPYHDKGVVKRIGDITTPWPCFMLAARESVVSEKLEELQKALAAVHEAAQLFHSRQSQMPSVIASEYGLKPEDAQAWYKGVQISADRYVSESALERAVEFLKLCKLLDETKTYDVSSFVDPRLAELRRDLRSMTLYDRSELVTTIHRQLNHAGLSKGTLHYQQLLPFDQHHYHGTKEVDDVISECGITDKSRVINIGSGLGGPARYMAGQIGCQVLAVEIQEDLSRTASELTQRCQLDNKVHHVNADFMQISQHFQGSAYDHVVSWLTVLHFSDRVALFKRCHFLLRPGGIFFAADFYQKGHLTAVQLQILRDHVGCPALAGSKEIYRAELESSGFKIDDLEDVTEDWKTFTEQRVKTFETQQYSMTSIVGQEAYEGMLHFYTVVRDLFASGGLGGLRAKASRPLGW